MSYGSDYHRGKYLHQGLCCLLPSRIDPEDRLHRFQGGTAAWGVLSLQKAGYWSRGRRGLRGPGPQAPRLEGRLHCSRVGLSGVSCPGPGSLQLGSSVSRRSPGCWLTPTSDHGPWPCTEGTPTPTVSRGAQLVHPPTTWPPLAGGQAAYTAEPQGNFGKL